MSTNFWNSANLAFSDEERDAFNRWRSQLYRTGDLLRDVVRELAYAEKPSDDMKKKAVDLAEDILSKVTSIPGFIL